MSDLQNHVRVFADEIRRRIRTTVAIAKKRPVEGSRAWNDHLQTMGLRAFTDDKIHELRRLGPASKTGALPIEVRQALQKVKDDADAKILEFEFDLEGLEQNEDASAGAVRETLDRLKDELRNMVDTEVKNYVAVMRSSVDATGKAGALKCPTCGARQPQDDSPPTCAYCGGRMT